MPVKPEHLISDKQASPLVSEWLDSEGIERWFDDGFRFMFLPGNDGKSTRVYFGYLPGNISEWSYFVDARNQRVTAFPVKSENIDEEAEEVMVEQVEEPAGVNLSMILVSAEIGKEIGKRAGKCAGTR